MRYSRLMEEYKMPVFLAGVIVVALALVGVAMKLYYSSDAVRLDLSRPEYVPVRDQINQAPAHDEGFSSQGGVTKDVLKDFMQRYQKETKAITENSPFSPEALSDGGLGLGGE